MKKITYLLLFVGVVMFSSCVTGNDDSAVLNEHEAAFARTPKVTNLLVNGVAKTRDTQSVWNHFFVNVGDVVTITGTIDSGNGAASSTYNIFRQYYGQVFSQEGAFAVEPMTEMEFEYSAGTTDFSISYTVPEEDDDAFTFGSGNIITITFVGVNDLGGAGYEDLILEFE